MKISKDRLKEIIAEEMSISFGGVGMEPAEHEGHEDHGGDADGHMAKQNLWKMAEYARELYELIDDNEDLEPWVEEKIAIAAFMMDSVGHYMQYEKRGGNSEEMGIDHEESEDEEEYEYEPEEDEEYGDEEEYEDEEDEV